MNSVDFDLDVDDIIVVGTDTGVGKTVVSLLLMQVLHANGFTPKYLKPFQTGCIDPYDRDSDAAFVFRHTPALKKEDPAQAVFHCYPSPKAPYFAARDAGVSIDADKVADKIGQARFARQPLVVEAAGGLMVPVTKTMTVVELIPVIECRPLLVARPGLGTINHTLLSIEALHRKNIDLLGVVFVESVHSRADAEMIAENMEAIKRFSGIQVSGVIPAISDFFAPPATAYQPLKNLLFRK